MTPFEEMVEAVAFRFNHQIQKICEPLFNYFGMNSFWYYKVTNEGHFFYLGSSVKFDEFFSGEKFYLDYPYFRHPKHFQNSFSLMKTVPNERVSQVIDHAVNQHHFHNSVVLIDKTLQGIEVFGFSFTSSSESQYMLAINELPLLRLFAKKFREDHPFLASKMEDHQINLLEIIGPRFYEKSTPVIGQGAFARETFLKQMGIENPLSPREIEVARLLRKGCSASQIGKQKFLSTRTIEHHLERMKDKLGCKSKAELIQKARELEHLGYFNREQL